MAFCSNCLSKWFNILSSFLSLLFKLFPFLYVSLFWPLFHTNQNYLVLFIRDMLQRCLCQTTLSYVLLINYVMFVTKRGIGQQDNLCLTQLVNNVRLIIMARITGHYERQWKRKHLMKKYLFLWWKSIFLWSTFLWDSWFFSLSINQLQFR